MNRTFYKPIVIALFWAIFTFNATCQNQQRAENQVIQLNCFDSLGNKIGLWIEYDIENIKYSETYYSTLNKVEYRKYFNRHGDEILSYSWKINNSSLKKLIDLIKSKILFNDLTSGQGSAVVLFFADCDNNIFELRIIQGISTKFNNELLRVTKEIEDKIIFLCSDNCKTPIITYFPIKLR